MKTARQVAFPFVLALVVIILARGFEPQRRSGSASVSGDKVQAANLIYAVNKTSVCYSDRFLSRLTQETNIETDQKLHPSRLATSEVFKYPFSIMTGEGSYTLTPKERINLKYYVTHGGFLVASASCSDPDWTRSFRTEIAKTLPDLKLAVIPLTHPIYRTVYTVTSTHTIHDQRGANLEGIFYKGKIVVVFSPDGLNDTSHAENCCCCGGDELDQAEYMNVNILAYALLH